jgi:glycosyltransferase involved in cell wall biosynthesis
MKILFLSHYFPPEGNAPAARTHENCLRWVRAGHDVTVVTCAPNVPNGVVYAGYRNRWRQEERIDGIRVVRVWTYIAANKGTVLRIVNFLSYLVTAVWAAARLPRPDVVIATSPQFFCGWAGVWVARLRRRPFVLEIRDLWPESIAAVGAGIPPLLLRWLEHLERAMYRAADRIVTVGDGYRARLLERGVPEAKLAVIMNGVDPAIFRPETTPALPAGIDAASRFIVLYAGTIGMASGLDVILDAAARLQAAGRVDILFLVVGDGAERENLEREARKRGLDAVRFTGRLPREELPGILAAADACLVHLKDTPLFATVMPSKIFEAAAMRRPIILGVRGFAADWLRTAGAGLLVPPEDAGALVDAVLRLEADRELCRRLGDAGYSYVVRFHDRDALAGRYLREIECSLQP